MKSEKTRMLMWRRRVALFFAIIGILGILESKPAFALESKIEMRDKIITLIEDKLGPAYSFTPASTHNVPHFEVLDKLYPTWHYGEPSVARQFWVDAGYTLFTVLYRVDYVYIKNDVVAEVEGKKMLIWTELDDTPDLAQFWPFQIWSSLQYQRQRDNTYLSAAYAVRYKMKLTLNEVGDWIIVEERLHKNPAMLNNIKNHCVYEKQMATLGLKNECEKKQLLPF